MTTSLGLYGGPKTAWPSILSADSATFVINIEVAGQAAVSTTEQINIEVADQDAVTATKTINIEVAPVNVPGGPSGGGEGAPGGTPDALLNLPTYAKASRLRADFYTLDVKVFIPARSIENIGVKIGSAPLASIYNFSYNYELDAVGSWSIDIPANDERASVIIDGTAKIIKLYYEDVGHIFTGYIEDYEIVDSETMRVSGTDLMARLIHNASMWQIDTRLIRVIKTTKYWRDYYQDVISFRLPGLDYQFESMPTEPVFVGDGEIYGEFIGIVPTYQSQTILDVLRDFNATSGVHFRIHPTLDLLTVGLFGDDSGLIIAPIGEDDPKVREEGALVLKSFSYIKTKEELTNMIVVQGSNDSFGIAVELRHSSKSLIDEQRYADTISEEQAASGSAQQISFVSSVAEEDQYPVNNIPQDVIEEVFDATIQSTSGILSTVPAWVGYNPLGVTTHKAVVGIPFTASASFYPTFAVVFNLAGVGSFNMAIVPSSGGTPDTSDLFDGRMEYKNYFLGRLPGDKAIREGSDVTISDVKPEGEGSQLDREYGILTELMGFLDHGTRADNGLPWPLLTAGDYFLLVWMTGADATIPGFNWSPGFPGTVGRGSPERHLSLLKNSNPLGSGNAVYLGEDGVWRTSSERIVFSVHGRLASSISPYPIEGLFAPVIKDNGSGHRVFFMRDIESIKEHGQRQRVISFPNAIDTSEGIPDIIPASDMLHDQAKVYIDNHKDPFEKLTVTCTGLFRLPFVGQQVRFVYRGMALNENGEYKWLDINSLWNVLSVNWQITNEGLEHTLVLSNISDDLINPRNISAEFARHIERSKNNLGELHISSRRLGEGITASQL